MISYDTLTDALVLIANFVKAYWFVVPAVVAFAGGAFVAKRAFAAIVHRSPQAAPFATTTPAQRSTDTKFLIGFALVLAAGVVCFVCGNEDKLSLIAIFGMIGAMLGFAYTAIRTGNHVPA